MSVLDKAMSAVSGVGAPVTPGSEESTPTLETLPGSQGYLKEYMDRRRGLTEAPSSTPAQSNDPDYKSKYEALQAKIEAIESQTETYQKTNDKLFQHLEQFANRPSPPATVIQQAAPTPEPLPSLDLDDQELVAAFNTFESRQDKKAQAYLNQIEQRLGSLNSAYAQRDFENALRRAKAKPDFAKYFDEKDIRGKAQKLIRDPNYAGMDWDNELELAYKARSSDDRDKELEELRAYKTEQEKKVNSDKERQKKNLGNVPNIGGRGASTGPTNGLIMDKVLADARKAKRRLSIAEAGEEYFRRRSAG